MDWHDDTRHKQTKRKMQSWHDVKMLVPIHCHNRSIPNLRPLFFRQSGFTENTIGRTSYSELRKLLEPKCRMKQPGEKPQQMPTNHLLSWDAVDHELHCRGWLTALYAWRYANYSLILEYVSSLSLCIDYGLHRLGSLTQCLVHGFIWVRHYYAMTER